ncbi:MAG: arabinofuranosyltransferase [Bacteroidota bacterium]
MSDFPEKENARPNQILSAKFDLIFSKSILAFSIAAVVFFLIFTSTPYRFNSEPIVPVMLSLLSGFSLIGIIAVFYNKRTGSNAKSEAIVYILGIMLSGAAAFTFKNSEFGIGAAGGDIGFINALIVKMAYTGGYADNYYKGLSSFYPPLYYWLCAKASVIFSIKPHEAHKCGFILSMYLLPILTWLGWGRITGKPQAAIFAFAFLFNLALEKAAPLLSFTLFVPWWLYFIENTRRTNFTTRQLVIASVTGGIIIQLQFFWLLPASLGLGIRLIAERFGFLKFDEPVRPQFNSIIIIALGSAFVASPYLIPYLSDMLTIGTEPTQNLYYRTDMGWWQFPFFQPTLWSFLWLFGLLYSIYSIGSSALSRALIFMVAGIYAYSLLGFFGVLIKVPILFFKAYYLLEYLLSLMALHAIWSIAKQVYSQSREYFRVTALATASVFLYLSWNYAHNLWHWGGEAAGSQTPELVARDLREIDPVDSLRGKVIITSNDSITTFFPVYTFLYWNSSYSNPAALYKQRTEFLEKLSVLKDRIAFAAALMNNKFDHPDYVLFKANEENKLRIFKIKFPYKPEEAYIKLSHDNMLAPYFTNYYAAKHRIYKVNKKHNPLPEGTIELNRLSPGDAVTLLILKAGMGNTIPCITDISIDILANRVSELAQKEQGVELENILRLGSVSLTNAGISADALSKLKISVAEGLKRIISSGKEKVINTWEAEAMHTDWQNAEDLAYTEPGSGKKIRRVNPEIFSKPHPSGNALFFTDEFELTPGTYTIHFDWQCNSNGDQPAGQIQAIAASLTELIYQKDLSSNLINSANSGNDLVFTITDSPKVIRLRYYHTNAAVSLSIDKFSLTRSLDTIQAEQLVH